MEKSHKIIIRCSPELKRRLLREAELRGEAEAVIVREALREYFDVKDKKFAAVAASEDSARIRLNDAATAKTHASQPTTYRGKRK